MVTCLRFSTVDGKIEYNISEENTVRKCGYCLNEFVKSERNIVEGSGNSHNKNISQYVCGNVLTQSNDCSTQHILNNTCKQKLKIKAQKMQLNMHRHTLRSKKFLHCCYLSISFPYSYKIKEFLLRI